MEIEYTRSNQAPVSEFSPGDVFYHALHETYYIVTNLSGESEITGEAYRVCVNPETGTAHNISVKNHVWKVSAHVVIS
jgi:hypothetical protein